jgi:hypothetical protein
MLSSHRPGIRRLKGFSMETEARVVVSPPQGKITSNHDNPAGDYRIKIAAENPALAIAKEVIEAIADSGVATLTKVMGEASKVADKGVSVYLFTMATVLMFFGFLFKMGGAEMHIGTLAPGEYEITFGVAAMLALAGALLRVYVYKCEFGVYAQALKSQQDLADKQLDLAKRAMDTGKEILVAGTKAAQAVDKNAHVPDKPALPG